MYCVIKCYVCGSQARVKNADLRHPSCTVVMYRRKSVSPVLNVLIITGLESGMQKTYEVEAGKCMCMHT